MQKDRSSEPPDVRGDKYMADAYERAWSALMERRAGAAQKER
jgi:hypothetical protein